MASTSKCTTCHRPLTPPPSLSSFQDRYPTTPPSLTLDRSLARCRRCDYKTADRKAMNAELPPPDHKNPVKEIERDIERSLELIAQGAHSEGLERVLPIMEERLREAVFKRDQGIRAAWADFEAIWGSREII